MKIVAAKSILRANEQIAAENRRRLDAAGVVGVNIVGSPGSGKTTLLEALFAALEGRVGLAVIEGDIAGTIDAERMQRVGVPVVQINTEGACHLDANMIGAALDQIDLRGIDFVFIENVGNLVCTAGFDLGERIRIAVLSTAEGDDKAVKYPAIFQSADSVVITKCDLRGMLNFDAARFRSDVHRLNPAAAIFEVSALHNEGLGPLAQWLEKRSSERPKVSS